TNHLDLPSVERLEDELAAYEGALVIITHDDGFAEALIDEMLRLDAGSLESEAGHRLHATRLASLADQLSRLVDQFLIAPQVASAQRLVGLFEPSSRLVEQVLDRRWQTFVVPLF